MPQFYPGNDVEIGTIVGTNEVPILNRQDRARHTYIVGSSRTGKTKLVESMCRQDLLNWPNHQCPMVVIDPADTLYDGLMAYPTRFTSTTGWP
jgi:DNA helicase HerA-like ATPase